MTISLISVLACTPKEPYYEAPSELDIYVQKFIEEGEKRGVSLNIEEEAIVLEFGELTGNEGGKCAPNAYPKQIVIDRGKWLLINQHQREMLVFHELGHCILNRVHKNEKLPHGECVSLMDGNENGFSCSNNFTSAHWREYYVNELFNDEEPVPDWYRSENNYFVQEDQKTYVVSEKNPVVAFNEYISSGKLDSLAIDDNRNYQAEVIYNTPPKSSPSLSLWWKEFGLVVHHKLREERELDKSLIEIKPALYRHVVDRVTFPLKLTIRKKDDFLYFYVNEKIVHQTDNTLMNTGRYNVLTTLLKPGETELSFSFVYLQ